MTCLLVIVILLALCFPNIPTTVSDECHMSRFSAVMSALAPSMDSA